MPSSFIYRPHVHEGETVVTPDVLIDDVYLSDNHEGAGQLGRVTLDRITCDTEIQVLGEGAVPDAALFLAGAGAGTLVGLASNHSLPGRSKWEEHQLTVKSVGRAAWRLDHAADHIDQLRLSSWVIGDDGRELLQDGMVSDLGDLPSLVEKVSGGDGGLTSGTALLCIGLPFNSTSGAAGTYAVELLDPILDRRLELHYHVTIIEPLMD